MTKKPTIAELIGATLVLTPFAFMLQVSLMDNGVSQYPAMIAGVLIVQSICLGLYLLTH